MYCSTSKRNLRPRDRVDQIHYAGYARGARDAKRSGAVAGSRLPTSAGIPSQRRAEIFAAYPVGIPTEASTASGSATANRARWPGPRAIKAPA